jgi:NADPH2:quinone reductase
MAAQLPKTQRKWICEKLGAENLVLHTDAPVALPESPYDIVVRIYAAALNPVDWKMCDWGAPRGIGIDGTGLVVAVGSSVDTTQFRVGESIIYFHAPLFNLLNGAVAEYCLMDSRYAAIVPESLLSARGAPGSAERQHLYEELASLPTAAFTAHQLVISKLHFDIFGERNSYQGAHANIINVRYVLVTAGAGGVGGFCLQLLRLWLQNSLDAAEREKVKIIATSSKNNFDYVKQLGATHTIDYNSENLEERIKELTDGNGIDVWIDLVGKSSVE